MNSDLIARIESAEAGSRELSDEVLLACGWRREKPKLRISAWWVSPESIGYCEDQRPSPTESVDDALGLVPEGWWLHGLSEMRHHVIYANDKHEPLGKYTANLQHYGGGRLTTGQAATPALALCAAVLRVRKGE